LAKIVPAPTFQQCKQKLPEDLQQENQNLMSISNHKQAPPGSSSKQQGQSLQQKQKQQAQEEKQQTKKSKRKQQELKKHTGKDCMQTGSTKGAKAANQKTASANSRGKSSLPENSKHKQQEQKQPNGKYFKCATLVADVAAVAIPSSRLVFTASFHNKQASKQASKQANSSYNLV
jgi:hypothetical protein